MSKRRRTSSIASKSTEDESVDNQEASTSSGPTMRKRKKVFDPMEVCHQLYDIIRNHKKKDGSLLCDLFIRVPKRRQEPGYYDVVTNPIDLLKVQQKLKTDEYNDVDDLQSDIELIVNNTKAFYKRSSQEYRDATELWELFLSSKSKLMNVEEEPKKNAVINLPPPPPPTPVNNRVVRNTRKSLIKPEPIENNVNHEDEQNDSSFGEEDEDENDRYDEFFTSVMAAKDEHNKPLCPPFQLLPSRSKYPEYYEVVEQPIDLKLVATKVQTKKYNHLIEMERDLLLMCKNACLFNEPGSQIYKQAKTLRKIVQTKRLEMDQPPSPKANSSTPLKKVRSRRLKNITAITAALKSEDSDPEEEEPPPSPSPSKRANSNCTSTSNTPNTTRLSNSNRTSNTTKPPSATKPMNTPKNSNTTRPSNTPKPSNTSRPSSTPKPSNTSKVQYTPKPPNATKQPITPKNSMTPVINSIPEDPNNPQWKLFESIQNASGNNGVPLVVPFWRLPSRKMYPDYYKEIKNPVSLGQIKRKLMAKAYGTVSEVAGDLTVMFENAKKYNIPTSKLYKDAVRLQKLMQTKVQELLDIDQVTQRVTNKNRKLFLQDGDAARKKPGPKPKNLSPGVTPPRGPGRPPKDSIPLKKRLHTLAKYMLDCTCEDGRKPMMAFMEKPSKKLYPEYYEVIAEPIDFLEIESKIKAEQYSCEADLIKDFKLMFANCRQFNEENSPIYDDANLLEQYLINKVGPRKLKTNLSPMLKSNSTPEKPKKDKVISKTCKPRRLLSPLEKTLKTMYETMRDYREPKENRQLSLIFMRLPSKIDYPDYYEVIAHPMDMEKISQKLKLNIYNTLDDLISDFVLMLDNACKYNEPDSQIYKDALVLQRVCFQTKMQLKEDNNKVPDVQAAVQEILLNLFTNVYNHQDDDGRCYSDSMADLPEHDDVEGKKVRALSLDLIKRRLDKGLYKRLDVFQGDFFALLDRARRLSGTDSQIFEDAVEMQMYFIKQRDELCKHGELLSSPALRYTIADARSAIEQLKQSKLLKESLEEETETRSSDDSIIKDNSNVNVGESMTCNQRTFKVGEFVYLDAKEKGCEPHILYIERLWENNGQQMLYGNYYLRPAETYHLSTRKFLEREVFKSDSHVAVPLEEVKDRCCVVNVKQYYTMKPEGYDDKDVYVCESRYSTRCRSFKKIKIYPDNPTLKLVPRDVPLEPRRVMSVFRERVEKHKDELAELEEQEKIDEQDKPNVRAFPHMEFDDGNTYYEQFNTICSGVVKTGDFVYVVVEGGKQIIAQIDCIWEMKDGKCYFRGPWFITPMDIPNSTGKLFYKQEVFLSSLEDANPIVSIIGKCAVLEYNDYIMYRPTEIPEADVFICASMFDEINRQIRKLPQEGLKKYAHGPDVTQDEIYFFTKILNPPKEPLPQLTKMNDVDILMDDSLDGGPPSVGSGEIPVVVQPHAVTPMATPVSTKKKATKNKVVTGYILYSREVRKQVVQNNPESTFGDISRIVGSEWKSLSASEKQVWEERATKLNEETKALLLLEEQCSSPAPPLPVIPADQIYECLWDNCDFQFEEVSDLIEHCIKDKESQGHVQAFYQENAGSDFNCHWRNCVRHKKNVPPFPNMTRLIRHVRDMHINKGNGRVVPPENRSKNFKPSSKLQAASRPTPSATPNPSPVAASVLSANTQKPQEPLFITVPPRPQRVLHSEAYIRYIEGLQAENKHITPWEKALHATQENTPAPDMEKLQNITTWLGRKADQHDNVVAALWSLRNQLMKDTLSLHKTL